MQNFRILYSIFVLILFAIYIYLGFKTLIILTSTVVLISVIILTITRGTSNVRRFPLPVALAPGSQNIFKTKVQVTDTAHPNRKKTEHIRDEKMYSNTSFYKTLRDVNYGFNIDADRSVWRIQSPGHKKSALHPSVRQRGAPVTRRHSFSFRRNSFSEKTSDLTLNKSFLPSVKRALGLETITNSSRNLSLGHDDSYSSHPEVASPGFVPAVRLGRHNKHDLSHIRLSAVRSPNTVKIAPPDLQKLCSPRLLEVRSSSRETTPGARLTPDTQSVLIALKEKSRKRTANTIDQENPYIDVPQQKAKRRRQESQQSNASTSSLPPMPDNLPDLSMSGYTIPRLETPTLKRPALMDSLDWDDEDQNNEPKRMRREGRYNSIISSLSSSKRFSEKDSRSNSPFATEKLPKRKVEETTDKENVNKKLMKQGPSNSQNDELSATALSRSDTFLLQPDFDATDTEIQTNTEDVTADLSQSVTPKLKQRVSLNKTVSARKRQMSLYSGLNKSFTKVPQANVVANLEDYTADRQAEQSRVQQMLDDISSAEEKAKKTTASQVTSVTDTGPTSTVSGQLPGLTSQVSTPIMTSSVVTVLAVSSSPTSVIANKGTVKTSASLGTGVTTDKDTVKTNASSGTGVTTDQGTVKISASSDTGVTTDQGTVKTSALSGTGQATAATFSFTPVFGKPTATTAGSVTGTTLSSAPVKALFNMPAKTSVQLNPVTSVSSGVSLFGSGVTNSTSTAAQSSSLQTSTLATPLSGFVVSSTGSSSFSSPASLVVSSSNTSSLPTYDAAFAAKTVNQTSGFQMPQTVPSTQQPPANNIQFGSTSASIQVTNSSAFSGASSAQFTFGSSGQNMSTGQSATTSVTGPFVFGSTTSQTSVTVPTYCSAINTTNTKTSGNPLVFGSVQQNSTSGFGGIAPINSTSTFGGNMATTKSLNFGSGAMQGFGITANTTPSSGSSFFGASNSQFNSGNAVPNSTNLIFGTAVSQTSSGAAFGSGTPSFGAVTHIGTPSFGGKQQSGTASFGAAQQSGTPNFGATQQSGTSFGASQQSETSSFGAPQPSSISMFGTNTTKSGSVFGGNTTQGSSSYGSTGKPSFTPVFGVVSTFAQTSGTSVFGSVTKPTATTLFAGIPSTSQATGAPIFGGTPANTTSSIPTFGVAPAKTQVGVSSIFGSTPSITKACETTLFGGTPSKTQAAGTPLFGGSVQTQSTGAGLAFGANTPKSNTTQSGFGGSTPAFSFGANVTTPQAENKGFNFAGNVRGSTPSFNFGGATANNSSAPVFGTNPGNSTPSFGAAGGNMFSVGSGQSTPKPRAVARPKRRGTRNR